MNALIEKKNEFIAKKNEIYKRRQERIDAKVSEYRRELETADFDDSEIIKINKVIAAIDEVLAYESGYPDVESESSNEEFVETIESEQEQSLESVEEVVEPTKAESHESARPGMQSFNVDRR